jgi:hypothetical protein
MSPRFTLPSRHARSLLALVCGLMMNGCHTADTSGEVPEADEHHAGHVIPAHKPKTFPDAVNRLRGLTGHLGDSHDLLIAQDIAGWLPELAADSDMPEPDWNNVSVESSRLTAALARLQTGSGNQDNAQALEQAGIAVANLERQLESANPQWFRNQIASVDSK